MKHFKYLFLFIGLALFASCSESDVEGGVIADKNQAKFSGVVKELQTRVTGTSWDENDEVGIYALIGGQEVVYDNMANVQYKTTSGDGVFAPVSSAIRFPDDGSNLDFVAYYPYDSKVTDLEYTVERGTDLLYSNNATGQNKETPDVSLEFKHALSKLVLNVGLGNNLTSLEGLAVTINNVSTTGKVNLANDDVTVGAAESITPTVVFAEDNKKATITELVMPTQDLQNAEIEFTLGDNIYKWSPDVETLLASNTQYSYKLNLNVEAGELVVVEVGKATIGDWEVGHEDEGFTVLDPEVEATKIDLVDFREAVANGEVYTEDKYIEGEVILNPANQVVNNAVAAVSDGTAGISFFFGFNDDVAAALPLGAKVKVDLKNGKWNVYNGLVQFEVNVAAVEIVEETASTPLEPKVITIQDVLDGKYQSDLVQINDVQFKEIPATYSGNNVLVNESNEEVNVYIRKEAAFADENVPEGNGPFIGVVNHFNNPQLAVRKVDDLADMTGDRFEIETEPTVGDGTKENPYTVADAFAINDTGMKDVWVKGFIVGYKKSGGYSVGFSPEGAEGTNIVIADDKDETDGAKALGVQLPSGAGRTDLNLKDNSYMYKAEVILKGEFGDYFGSDEGLKDVKEYEIIAYDSPFLVSDLTELEFQASGDALTQAIELTTTDTETWTITSDADWLSVAPESGTGSGSVEVTAQENTEAAVRTAKVTITAGDTSIEPVVVDVNQVAAGEIINDGSKEHPFTVAEAIEDNVGSDVWVKGYIVGAFVNNKPDFTASGQPNLMIADDANELNGDNVIPVRVATGYRDPLCKEESVGKQVLLKGDLGAYFSREGITKISGYEFVE